MAAGRRRDRVDEDHVVGLKFLHLRGCSGCERGRGLGENVRFGTDHSTAVT